jgi:hypothetical protein
VRHLPILAQELTRIMELSEGVLDHCRKAEHLAIKRSLREGDDTHAFLKHLDAELATAQSQPQPWRVQLEKWQQRDMNALSHREQPPARLHHAEYAEPALA